MQNQIQNQNQLYRQLVQTLQKQIESINREQKFLTSQVEHLAKQNSSLSQKYMNILRNSRQISEKESKYQLRIKDLQDSLIHTQNQLLSIKQKISLSSFSKSREQITNNFLSPLNIDINKGYASLSQPLLIMQAESQLITSNDQIQQIKQQQKLIHQGYLFQQEIQKLRRIIIDKDKQLQQLKKQELIFKQTIKILSQEIQVKQQSFEQQKQYTILLKNQSQDLQKQLQQKNNEIQTNSKQYIFKIQQYQQKIQQLQENYDQRNQQTLILTQMIQQLTQQKQQILIQQKQLNKHQQQRTKVNEQYKTKLVEQQRTKLIKQQQKIKQSEQYKNQMKKSSMSRNLIQQQKHININFLRNSMADFGTNIDFQQIARQIGFDIQDQSLQKKQQTYPKLYQMQNKIIVNNSNKRQIQILNQQITNQVNVSQEVLRISHFDQEMKRFPPSQSSFPSTYQQHQFMTLQQQQQSLSLIQAMNQKNQELMERVAVLERELQEERDKIRRIQRDNNQDVEMLGVHLNDHIRREIQHEMQQKLDIIHQETQNQLILINQQIEYKQSRINSISQQLVTNKNQLTIIKDQLATTKSQLITTKSQLKTTIQQLSQLIVIIEQSGSIKKQLSILKQSNEKFIQQIKQKQASILDLIQQITQLTNRMNDLHDQNQALTEKVNNYQYKLKQTQLLQNQKNQLKLKIIEQQKQISILQVQKQQINQKLFRKQSHRFSDTEILVPIIQQNFIISNISQIQMTQNDQSFLQDKQKQLIQLNSLIQILKQQYLTSEADNREKDHQIFDLEQQLQTIQNKFNGQILMLRKINAEVSAQLLNQKKQLLKHTLDGQFADLDKFIAQNILNKKHAHIPPNIAHKYQHPSRKSNKSYHIQNPNQSLDSQRPHINLSYIQTSKPSSPLNMGQLFIGRKTKARGLFKQQPFSNLADIFRTSNQSSFRKNLTNNVIRLQDHHSNQSNQKYQQDKSNQPNLQYHPNQRNKPHQHNNKKSLSQFQQYQANLRRNNHGQPRQIDNNYFNSKAYFMRNQ